MAIPRPAIPLDQAVGVDLRHHPPNVCKVAVFHLKVYLADSVILWWKALKDMSSYWRSGGRSLGLTELRRSLYRPFL